MAVSDRLKGFLQERKVRYAVAKHPVAYTAQEIAAAQHVSGRQLAKCVLVLADGKPVLAVLPAAELIALPKLKAVLNAKQLSIAREADIKQHFPDVEVGAMPPFGNLYGVPVIAEQRLSEVGDIVFNAGSHAETIRMAYTDFARLAKPRVAAFGQPVPGTAPAKRRAKKKAGARKKPARRATSGRLRRGGKSHSPTARSGAGRSQRRRR